MSEQLGDGYQEDRKVIAFRLQALQEAINHLSGRIDKEIRDTAERREDQHTALQEVKTQLKILGVAIVMVMSALLSYILKIILN